MTFACYCGSNTASKGWCFDGKHPRRSPRAKHTTCTLCGAKNRSNGLCERHYKQAYRAGLIATRRPKKEEIVYPSNLWAFIQAELGKN